MGAEVEVAEAEPLRHGAVCRELTLDAVALVGAAPALLLVDAAAEGVEQVSRSGQTRRPNRLMSSPVLPMTVSSASASSGVAVEVGAEAAEEPGAADASGQGGDAHARSLAAVGRTCRRGRW